MKTLRRLFSREPEPMTLKFHTDHGTYEVPMEADPLALQWILNWFTDNPERPKGLLTVATKDDHPKQLHDYEERTFGILPPETAELRKRVDDLVAGTLPVGTRIELENGQVWYRVDSEPYDWELANYPNGMIHRGRTHGDWKMVCSEGKIKTITPPDPPPPTEDARAAFARSLVEEGIIDPKESHLPPLIAKAINDEQRRTVESLQQTARELAEDPEHPYRSKIAEAMDAKPFRGFVQFEPDADPQPPFRAKDEIAHPFPSISDQVADLADDGVTVTVLRRGDGTDDQPTDMVNHPPHYNSHPSGVECITVTEHMNFCRGNAMKYLWRAGEKGDALEDLKKARWYLDREISRLQADAERE